MLKLSLEEIIVASSPLPPPERHVVVDAFASNLEVLAKHFAQYNITLELYSEAKQVTASRAIDFFASGRNRFRLLVCYGDTYIGRTGYSSLLPKNTQTMEQYIRCQFGMLFKSIERIVDNFFQRRKFAETIDTYIHKEARSVFEWVSDFNRDMAEFLNGGLELRFYSNVQNNARCDLSALMHQSIWTLLYGNGRKFNTQSDCRVTSLTDVAALQRLLVQTRESLLERFDYFVICA